MSTIEAMDLEGWSRVPDGYGARFSVRAAPLWLRWLFHTPVVDRFAYPILVRKGLGVLVPFPGAERFDDEAHERGWVIEEAWDGRTTLPH